MAQWVVLAPPREGCQLPDCLHDLNGTMWAPASSLLPTVVSSLGPHPGPRAISPCLSPTEVRPHGFVWKQSLILSLSLCFFLLKIGYIGSPSRSSVSDDEADFQPRPWWSHAQLPAALATFPPAPAPTCGWRCLWSTGLSTCERDGVGVSVPHGNRWYHKSSLQRSVLLGVGRGVDPAVSSALHPSQWTGYNDELSWVPVRELLLWDLSEKGKAGQSLAF